MIVKNYREVRAAPMVDEPGVTETGGAVSLWADQSGNSRDAAAAVGAEPTLIAAVSELNNQPALRFEATARADGVVCDGRALGVPLGLQAQHHDDVAVAQFDTGRRSAAHQRGRLGQGRLRSAGERDQRHAQALDNGQDGEDFLGCAGIRQRQYHVLGGDHTQVAVAGFARVDEMRWRAGGRQCGGNTGTHSL